MGKCIKIINDKMDVSKVIKQLEKYPEDWGSQQKLENVELKEVEPPVVASLLKQYLRYKNKFIYFDFTYFLNDFIFSTQGTSGQYFDQ